VAELTPQMRAFADRLRFTLRIPGTHPSGLSYEELFDILAAQGRDFGADSPQLRGHIRYALREQFDGGRAPGRAQLRQIAEAAILEWIVSRIEMGLRDVPIRPNDPKYRRWKMRNAAYSRVGMRTGALRDRIRDRARVSIEGP
jgi:hypothetical protein